MVDTLVNEFDLIEFLQMLATHTSDPPRSECTIVATGDLVVTAFAKAATANDDFIRESME